MKEELKIPKKVRINSPIRLAKIPISEINPGARIRKWEDDDEESKKSLMESIKERGLISPITVMEYAKEYEGFKYFLLAGGRRLGAMKALGQREVSANIYPSDLSADEIYAIELRENIDRKDFTPEEEAKAIKQFHEACIRLYGQRGSGQRKEDGGHSLEDTASLLGLSKSKVHEAVNAAVLFEQVPELGKVVKKWSDLRKITREADRKMKRDERIKEIKKEKEEKKESPVTSLKDVISKWYEVKDAVEGLRQFGSQTVDLVEFDPHYPIREDERSQQGSYVMKREIGDYHSLSVEEFRSFFLSVSKEAYRVLRPTGWYIVWFGMEFFPLVVSLLKEAGFPIKDTEFEGQLPFFYTGKWYKKGFGHTANPYHTLNHTVENFLYVKKTQGARLNKPHEDVFIHSPNHASKKINPFEKPISLYQEIFETFVDEQSLILSACTGSGNALLAAANHNCIAKGFDLSEAFHEGFIVRAHSALPPNYK